MSALSVVRMRPNLSILATRRSSSLMRSPYFEPGTKYGDRINELDLRVAKMLRFGRMRTTLSADIYNLMNAAPILSYNEAFIPGGAWLLPTSIMTARFARLNVQVDF